MNPHMVWKVPAVLRRKRGAMTKHTLTHQLR